MQVRTRTAPTSSPSSDKLQNEIGKSVILSIDGNHLTLDEAISRAVPDRDRSALVRSAKGALISIISRLLAAENSTLSARIQQKDRELTSARAEIKRLKDITTLSISDVSYMQTIKEFGCSVKEIADIMGVDQDTVVRVTDPRQRVTFRKSPQTRAIDL